MCYLHASIVHVMDIKDQASMLGNMLREVLRHSMPNLEINEVEMENIAQLCAMGTVSTGEEDPKSLIRPLSDMTIDSIILASKNLTNPILVRLIKIFSIEWCFRHGHLHEDWKWEWKTPREGQLHFRAITPPNEIKELSELYS